MNKRCIDPQGEPPWLSSEHYALFLDLCLEFVELKKAKVSCISYMRMENFALAIEAEFKMRLLRSVCRTICR